MKSYHLMVEAGREFDRNSHLYKFLVGTSPADKRAYDVVSRYAKVNGCFLDIWDIQTRNFVEQLAKSINCDVLQLKWIHIDVQQLAKHIKKYKIAPQKQLFSSAEIYTLRVFDYLIPA